MRFIKLGWASSLWERLGAQRDFLIASIRLAGMQRLIAKETRSARGSLSDTSTIPTAVTGEISKFRESRSLRESDIVLLALFDFLVAVLYR